MWTPTALACEAHALAGTVWRVVEHQYTTSTRKIVDTHEEQALLEALLEPSKPVYPPAADLLHPLLKTPFRYAPSGQGSRFRPPGAGPGVFYGADALRTALAELAYHRLRFFAGSSRTPLPRNEERLTAFTAEFHSNKAIDLSRGPFVQDRGLWMHPTNYGPTQTLAASARAAQITAIRYESVRDTAAGFNLALLTPSVFTQRTPTQQQTWLLYLGTTEVSCVRDRDPAEAWVFPRAHFGV